jgi:hypothetical protein
MVSTVVMILTLTVSGCITFNVNVPTSTPTPIPTATPVPTTTPSPGSTFPATDKIVGLWEGHKNSAYYSIQFNNDGTLLYDEAGNMAQGAWEKIANNQYRIRILISNTVITPNNNMTQFNWGDKGIIFTKKT